jgi:polar amino acid transport system substrate-binding protein
MKNLPFPCRSVYDVSILVLFLFVLTFSVVSHAQETWIIASETNFYPYNYWDKGKRSGVDVEIVDRILQDLKVIPKNITMSWSEVVATVTEGRCDMAYQFNEKSQSPQLILVGPFRSSRIVLMGKSDREFQVSSIKDLENYRVGVVADYRYGRNFDPNLKIKKLMSASLTVNLRRLMLERVDLIIGDINSMLATADREGFLSELSVLPWTVGHLNEYFAFPIEQRDKAMRFQASFEKLTRDGTIPAIIEKWVTAPDWRRVNDKSPISIPVD